MPVLKQYVLATFQGVKHLNVQHVKANMFSFLYFTLYMFTSHLDVMY